MFAPMETRNQEDRYNSFAALRVDIAALLDDYNIDDRPFTASIINDLQQFNDWTVPTDEYFERTDYRQELVLTIDPSTARDMDDALHIRYIGENVVQVGVHIADVSYFVQPNTELDAEARYRSTSVYLVKQMVPMLPEILRSDLCSLKPGIDRLTFTVLFNLQRDTGKIITVDFHRSIIRSAVQLSYDMAQKFIDEPNANHDSNELTGLNSSAYTAKDVCEAVNKLHRIAQILRRQRFQKGAIRLDRPQLTFDFDYVTGLPTKCESEFKDSANELVEEMMILANVNVAKRIYLYIPEIALLRRHPPPTTGKMHEMIELVKCFGYRVNGSTSKNLRTSLEQCKQQIPQDDPSIWPVLTELFILPMQRAAYFCSGSNAYKEAEFKHYGLGEDFCTHFTSPIRRYPDLTVHRLLAFVLEYSSTLQVTFKEMEMIANRATQRQVAAREASEASRDMMFALFVKSRENVHAEAVVVQVFSDTFTICLFTYGICKKIKITDLDQVNYGYYVEGPPPELNLMYNGNDQGTMPQLYRLKLTTFSRLNLQLIGIQGELNYKVHVMLPTTAGHVVHHFSRNRH